MGDEFKDAGQRGEERTALHDYETDIRVQSRQIFAVSKRRSESVGVASMDIKCEPGHRTKMDIGYQTS